MGMTMMGDDDGDTYSCMCLFLTNKHPPPTTDIFGRCTTREAKGAVEFWVATHASAFYGNIHSSFSAELVAEFRRMGKPGTMYTYPCQAGTDEQCM